MRERKSNYVVLSRTDRKKGRTGERESSGLNGSSDLRESLRMNITVNGEIKELSIKQQIDATNWG